VLAGKTDTFVGDVKKQYAERLNKILLIMIPELNNREGKAA
jgi:hypothetical protein